MSNLQLIFNFKKSIWSAPSGYKDLSGYDEIAIDLETRDEGINAGLGAGWATNNGEVIGFAVPATKIFHNAQYDVGWLRAMGIPVEGEIVDTMIIGALLDENRFSQSLNALSKEYLGELKAETDLREAAQQHGVDPKGEMWKLPAEHVGFYAEQDARLTFQLYQRFKPELYNQNLETIWEVEKQLLPITIKMREVGIRVDTEKCAKLRIDFKKQEKVILGKIKKLIGKDIDIWAARQIGFAFDKLGIDYPRTKTDEPSFTQNWLNNNPNEISKYIVQAREINKFHNTFLNSIMRFEHKGRIHGEIRQIKNDFGGAVSGRLSMSNPNLQQLPARSKEFGPMIRGLFLPEEGCQWGSFDYSQQEPRLVVHYAASIGEGYEGSQELVEAYANADADFHQTVADLIGIERKQAKTIGLGIMYGMGKNKLATMLGVDPDEAHTLISKYNTKAPFVKALSDRCMEKASSEGVIRTKLGRKCRFDMWEPKDFGIHTAEKFENASAKYGAANIKRAFTYKALNRLIQGSAADQTKQAVIDCSKKGFIPMLQIHDELCFSIRNEEEVKVIKDAMESCIDLKVPSVVDVALGKDFGEAS